MAIDYKRLRSLTVRRLISALKRDGFDEFRRKGATRFFAHPDGRTTTIHLHNMGQTFAVGT
ncbi:type II toxin-antitoxin system HicA family toxin [Candidatus Poribacteria bacterium]|nr:type II toxin-antitoxin system HicA family toxin [Candidatus Poribacteria bacterium]